MLDSIQLGVNVGVYDKNHIGLILSPDLCYPSAHKGKGIQALHPLVFKCVSCMVTAMSD